MNIEVVQPKRRKNKLLKEKGTNPSNLINIALDENICTTKEEFVDIIYWNARSIKNKKVCMRDYLSTENTDVFLVTETWLSKDEKLNKPVFAKLLPDKFDIQHVPRPDGREGG